MVMLFRTKGFLMTWRLDDDEGGKGDKEAKGGMAAKLLKARTIIVAETVTDKLYRKVAGMVTLLEQDAPDKPIDVLVNSPGGSADSGFAIYDLFRFSRCPIRCIANGIVASSGVLIYLGADDDQRFSLKHARFLLHQPSTAARGQASDIDITAKEIVKLRDRYNTIVERHTGKPKDQVTKDSVRDFWLSSDEAKEYGLVTRVVEHRGDLG